MLNFMTENKRILNLHEQNFAKLNVFQANTNVFQPNTNASLNNLETQMGQLTKDESKTHPFLSSFFMHI